jgi:outer membrane lipoprotein SlyB
MKTILAVAVLSAALAACATPYAPQEFDSIAIASGMVESVREVPLEGHAFEEAIEHSINPRVAEQLVIRLDDGSAVTLLEGAVQRFAPGQRVRIVAGRAEHE